MVLFAGVSAKITVRGQVEILPGRQISLSKNLTKKLAQFRHSCFPFVFCINMFFFVLGFCLDFFGSALGFRFVFFGLGFFFGLLLVFDGFCVDIFCVFGVLLGLLFGYFGLELLFDCFWRCFFFLGFPLFFFGP